MKRLLRKIIYHIYFHLGWKLFWSSPINSKREAIGNFIAKWTYKAYRKLI
jgi:hypothetical protein